MINQLLVAEVFNQPWCIEKQYAQGLAMAAVSIFKQDSKRARKELVSKFASPFAIDQSNKKQTENFSKGSVGVISLDGPVVENSEPYYGIKGTAELATEFLMMDANPNIIGTAFLCNTGGGAAYATKVMADTLGARTKPVGLLAKQTLCSAGYDIGSFADFIMMYHPQGIVGSIGTMCSFTDMQPMFEKWGMQFHEIYATLSTQKNKTYNDALDGNYEAIRAKMLDPMNKQFISRVKANRGDKITSKDKGVYQGETYMAEEAVSMGLIDGIGSLSDVISQIRGMAPAYSHPATKNPCTGNTPQSAQTPIPHMKFTKLTALAGNAAPTQEELDGVNAELAEAGITAVALFPESLATDAAEATANLVTAQAEVSRLTGELTTANTSVTALTTENGTLKGKLAKAPAAAAIAAAKADPVLEETEEQKGAKTIASLSHNQGILTNPLFQK